MQYQQLNLSDQDDSNHIYFLKVWNAFVRKHRMTPEQAV